MIRNCLLALALLAAGSSAQASSPCAGGRCHLGQTVRSTAKATTNVVRGTVRTTTRIVTAPVRRVFGR